MTPTTLFNIILKVLGIFLFVQLLLGIPQLFSLVLMMGREDGAGAGIWTFFSVILMFAPFLVAIYFLIFKADYVIQKFGLTNGIKEASISLNMHRSTILSICIIVLGGLLVISELPIFCQRLVTVFGEKNLTYGQSNPNTSYTIMSGVKILIGVVLMANQKNFVNLIERQRKS